MEILLVIVALVSYFASIVKSVVTLVTSLIKHRKEK